MADDDLKHKHILMVFSQHLSGVAQDGLYAWEQAHGAKNAAKVWFYVQAFLTAAANVSKALWPSPGARNAIEGTDYRGPLLRAHLGLPDEHPLKVRTMRDHLEHLDHRLADWVGSSERHNLVYRSIGSPGSIGGIDAGDVFHMFDPKTGTMHFRGRAYPLRPLRDALEELLKRIQERDSLGIFPEYGE